MEAYIGVSHVLTVQVVKNPQPTTTVAQKPYGDLHGVCNNVFFRAMLSSGHKALRSSIEREAESGSIRNKTYRYNTGK